MIRTRKRKYFPPALLLSFFLALCFSKYSSAQTSLFWDDFGSGAAPRWQLDNQWQVADDNGNFVLVGATHSWAGAGNVFWRDYSFKAKIKLINNDSAVHINYRSNNCLRYFIGFNSGELYLSKTSPCDTHTRLKTLSEVHNSSQWYAVDVIGNAGNVKVYVDGSLKIEYTDNAPVLSGSIAFEVLTNSPVYFDDVSVTADKPFSQTSQNAWVSTGGPLGGLGYDVRILPQNKNVMYVTDNWAGVLKSTDAGRLWRQSNSGISVKGGATGDAINIFSLTIDPNDSNIIWSGTYGEGSAYGVFKSTDGGSSWSKKIRGISLSNDSLDAALVFRGFTIQQGNSNIVYAQAEVPTSVQGKEFNRVKGRLYKTTDGGENWQLIWQGNNLARYLVINPSNSNILYLSTGIFDREAFNSDCKNEIAGGEGVLKSTDGGLTWNPINQGVEDLYIGSLRMHPSNPQVLFAATGNNACSVGHSGKIISGLFSTMDGGRSWTKVISGEIMTTVNFSPSNPDVIYAGSSSAFYRSRDGGNTWKRFSKPDASYGPAGVRAGVPIDVIIDPDDSNTLYANNYGGGVFRSRDGAATWEDWSKGYSGAEIHQVHIPDADATTVYAIGRSGPFKSTNGGKDWAGIANGDAVYAEWNSISTQPTNPNTILIADEHTGVILRSIDGGINFSRVFTHVDTKAEGPNMRQGFRALVFASSNPNIVYAGISKDRITFLASSPIGTAICKSLDGGATFSPMPSIVDGHSVRSLVVDSADANLVFAATTNGIYKSTNGAATWIHLAGLGTGNIEALAINPLRPGYLIAGEIFGGIWITRDAGTTWTGPHNDGLSSSNPYITSLVIDRANPDVVFAGDLYSGIYQSKDEGNTWEPFPDWQMSGLTMRAVKDIALNGTAMYVATQGGGVFKLERLPSLSVAKTGAGAGAVISSPSGINCGNTCIAYYPSGTSLILAANQSGGSCFIGWGTPCSGYGICNLALSGDTSLSAAFQPAGTNFCDVTPGGWAENYIDTIFYHNVTTGCVAGTGPDIRRYCPSELVTRAQMAAFIVRAKEGEPAPDYCDSGSAFADVPYSHWACRYIKRLKELNLTTGYGGPATFMPDLNVPRDQMAAFIIRAIEGDPDPNYCDSGSPFLDVPASSWSCKYIKRLKELKLTTGYGDPTIYRPELIIPRDQMAAFLGRAFLGMK